MTEREKRDKGLLYDANYDVELLEEQKRCKDLCFALNALKPSLEAERMELISQIFGEIGSILGLNSPFWCDYGNNISVGKNFYANYGLTILDCGKVTFGNHVFIAPNCGFYTAGHPIDKERRNEGLEFAYPIEVGDDVWFGANVQVMPGVCIGSNVVIGSGSVVTRNIPSGVLAVGNPCRVVREIGEEDREKVYLAWGN